MLVVMPSTASARTLAARMVVSSFVLGNNRREERLDLGEPGGAHAQRVHACVAALMPLHTEPYVISDIWEPRRLA